MHTPGPVPCRPKDIGTPRQEYWRKKFGGGKNNSGPMGRKATPRAVLSRLMAENARKYAPKKRT